MGFGENLEVFVQRARINKEYQRKQNAIFHKKPQTTTLFQYVQYAFEMCLSSKLSILEESQEKCSQGKGFDIGSQGGELSRHADYKDEGFLVNFPLVYKHTGL